MCSEDGGKTKQSDSSECMGAVITQKHKNIMTLILRTHLMCNSSRSEEFLSYLRK